MPAQKEKDRMKDLVAVYKRQIEKELGAKTSHSKVSSREYNEFKRAYMPKHMTLYEQLCNLSEKILKISPDKKKEKDIIENINIAHLNITPTGVVSFSFLAPLTIILFGSLLSYVLLQSTFFIFFFFIIGITLIKPLGNLPSYIANSWRLKASNQMVLCIFYVVTYMRHTSNIENALEFAADHLATPLSLDLKKVLWDVETEKYESIKESLEMYLQTWKKWNFEFIESFHLIESSLYEGSESRRLNSLDKSLDVILSETYEKMLHYAHNLQSPITMLHMLGIILPILGLVILPMVVSFMEGVRWYHIAALYNVALPVSVYYLGKNILSRRPTGYGQTDISEENPGLKKYKNVILKLTNFEFLINPIFFSIFIGVLFLIIGLSPVVMYSIGLTDFGFGAEDLTSECGRKFCMLGYRESSTTGEVIGPYGLGASVLSLSITMAFGLSIGIFYRLRSKNVIKIRERSKKLELEFASALFQLGNRLGDGLPAEIAFGKVADVMEGTISGSFFKLVSRNIRRLGMSVKKAVFDPTHGALVTFPSNLIESSMKVLIQSIKKGPMIAAEALTNVSRYIKEIHSVNERLKDLMADIISSMNSQIKFLTPAIAGIVIGITSMVTSILGKLGTQLQDVATGGQAGLTGLFSDGIPTYYFQIIVGLYVVQITYILTILVNGIENGSDKLSEKYQLGNNMIRGTLLFCTISLVVMLLFNMIASQILTSSLG
ncbi:MAG: hypothetical protein QF436_00830 [Candidatus Woesearchaeota archaeon]|jgi:hypothetical protein|nr:hypothetical protein [Candidatus Woesearchaeota archaeon]MDP7622641.1 hypothetical protein [Candidatus Woesearchaeota archaeon]HJN56463.1 hypothetical protein [Candidatus Woesearchaeota archaeon]|tara:strand:- start:4944 stop:7100 length:2157 start_codon:yes stop_codon:yes gene_type:complete